MTRRDTRTRGGGETRAPLAESEFGMEPETVADVIGKSYGLCESPIERKFFMEFAELLARHRASFIPANSQNVDSVLREYQETPVRQPRKFYHSDVTVLLPQLHVENYRLDFVVGRVSVVQGFNGNEPSELVTVKTPLVVVECDGHDFHERTKEQAQRDRSRDRDLTSLGFRVMRFTGSELHQDAPGCAKEVDDLLDSLATAAARI